MGRLGRQAAWWLGLTAPASSGRLGGDPAGLEADGEVVFREAAERVDDWEVGPGSRRTWDHLDRAPEDARREAVHGALEALVARYGLAMVHEELSCWPGLCTNCGTPIEAGQPHAAYGMGSCRVE